MVSLVLASVSEFVSGKLLPSIFTFPRDLVVGWLQKAKVAPSLPPPSHASTGGLLQLHPPL
jgi:hypothetical protein